MTKTRKKSKRGGCSLINSKLYPFWYNRLDFPKERGEAMLEDKTWESHLKMASMLYNHNHPLPKGTILFHGSSEIDPVRTITPRSSPFYFGLDAFIAIWYTYELENKNKSEFENKLKDTILTNKINKHEDSKDSITNMKPEEILSDIKRTKRRYYFLNIYETTKSIDYKYLSKSIVDENPSDGSGCSYGACLHPQFGYHGHTLDPPVELSMEFTIPANKVSSIVKLLGVYVVDTLKLEENKNNTFEKFHAIDAIVLADALYPQNQTKKRTILSSIFG